MYNCWKAGLLQFGTAKNTSQIQSDFLQLSTLVANISGMTPDIQNLKETWSTATAIPPALDDNSPVNFGPQTTKVSLSNIEPPKCIFRGILDFGGGGGAAPSNFYTR